MSARVTDLPITPAQVKSIHVALSRRKVDEETYRAMLVRFGGEGCHSCKLLTRRQASDLLAALARPLPNRPGEFPRGERRPVRKAAAPRRPAEAPGGAVQLATGPQRRLVEELRGEIAWDAEDGFERWLQASLGIGRVLTADEARRAIDGLKGLKRHGHGAR